MSDFVEVGKIEDDNGRLLTIEYDDNGVVIVRYEVVYTALLEQVVHDGKVYNSRMEEKTMPEYLVNKLKEYMGKDNLC